MLIIGLVLFFGISETQDEENEEVPETEYYVPKSSKKREMKRQERESQRQVCISTDFMFIAENLWKMFA